MPEEIFFWFFFDMTSITVFNEFIGCVVSSSFSVFISACVVHSLFAVINCVGCCKSFGFYVVD